jgi:hypothetical protein
MSNVRFEYSDGDDEVVEIDDAAVNDAAVGAAEADGAAVDDAADDNPADNDALLSRLRVIEDQPLESRAQAFTQLHDQLQSRLEGHDA